MDEEAPFDAQKLPDTPARSLVGKLDVPQLINAAREICSRAKSNPAWEPAAALLRPHLGKYGQ